jgi:hypothetical protein
MLEDLVSCDRNACGEACGGDDGSDLRRDRCTSACGAGNDAAQPIEWRHRQKPECPATQAEGATARGARA